MPGGLCDELPSQFDCEGQGGVFQGGVIQCSQLPDFDTDGTPDVCDLDDDNDGVRTWTTPA